ncbi:cobalamin-5'-phosphate synthase [Tumebacillus sp. BK434]|uniref:adenosylcobinamide-GDP ribazoletransferase n=1 Tax=Tumebacillus sp. BK434 TaxID=2512169 RepID=UPI0010461AE4|nr:adenosylcobinamide-GDP ribazoletransferase [Tumebacillus sp. BK434]TCP55786.1 cobalamin-5'-phosphate synthase [Tumebacillus sp. BK434]
MRLHLDAFWHALAFLTRFPVPKQLEAGAWPHSPPMYPLAGAVLGSVLALAAFLLQDHLPSMVLAMLLVTVWVYLTGGLHLDGLMDTADGFGSQRPRERVLEIMKDSRVGAMGVLAAVLLLGNKAVLLAHLQGSDLWLGIFTAVILGRTAMLFALYAFPYARAEGLAQTLRTRPRWYRLWPLLLAVPGLILLHWTLLFPLLAGGMLIAAAKNKLGGLTGDIYGALCELVEVTVLFGFLLT